MPLPVPRPWPVPLPKWFFPWAGWRLAGGRGVRPSAPRKIPAWAWVRLSYMKARPAAPQGKTVPWPFNGHGAVTTLPPRLLGHVTDSFAKARVRAVITEPWMQNGAGWHHLGDRGWVAMPEAFLNANPAYDPTVLCAHAKEEGMPKTVPLFGWGRWKDAPSYVTPAHYLSRWSFAVYPGDGKEQLYGEWER